MRTIILSLAFVIACGGSGRTGPDTDPDAVVAIDAATDAPIDAIGPPPGEFCGGLIPVECKPNEYCDYDDNTCGTADGSGTCKRRPDACPLVDRPVCACDGRIHSSDCIAFSDGFDLSANGGCALPAGMFACGYAVCDLDTQYCRHEVKAPDADIYTCVGFPQGCMSGPSCTCLRGELCGTSCSGDERIGLTVTCQ
jgi:hypothetical protein